jgi:tetratricopeptide (TPR) repeat protein
MATASTINDLTAGAIRQALTAAAAGRLADACAVGERALAEGGDIAALNAMLGMLQSKAGNAERALDHLRVAHRARPADPIIANNLVKALVQLEHRAEALDLLSQEVIAADTSGELLKLRGFLAQMTENFDLAILCYQEVVAREPDDCEMWNNLGNAYRSAGKLDEAIEALERAAKLDPTAAPIRLNLASVLFVAGEWILAERELRNMAADFPDDPVPLRELHAVLKEEGRDDEALSAIEGALERAPDDIVLLLAQASHLSHILETARSEQAYRRVIELDPKNSLAHIGLAFCFDVTNRTEELAGLVELAEQREVGPNALNFVKAFVHRRAKRYAEGLAVLEQVPDDVESSRRAHLMGQLLEGVGRYDEAFAEFTKMNELVSKEGAPPEHRATAYRELIHSRFEGTTEEWARRWRSETTEDPRPAPVFLVGFPRSGTTLLDTMLMGHPGIEVLEEERTLFETFNILADHDALPEADDQIIREARDTYFAAVEALTPLKPGNLLVDKNPLAMNAIPIIRRLFPKARIILAVRHPLDVVLSCYVTNFRLNAGMANFVSLDTTAELYDLSFSYFDRAQQLLGLPTHTVVYENVVADRDRELRSLFEFLELDWHDAVLDHQSTALSRGRIKTASYAQVTEPIYKRSAGRWQNYRKHLEPIFPVLRPWVEKFGYEL